jgi:hypothetical protein
MYDPLLLDIEDLLTVAVMTWMNRKRFAASPSQEGQLFAIPFMTSASGGWRHISQHRCMTFSSTVQHSLHHRPQLIGAHQHQLGKDHVTE